jgi:hypothetical protein
MMKTRSKGLWLVAALYSSVLIGPIVDRAEGGFAVTSDAGSPSGSGPFTWSYSLQLPFGEEIDPGNFFRIYDFGRYVGTVGGPGSIAAPAGWTTATAYSNPTPPPSVILNHGDDPAIANLIFTYTGPKIVNSIPNTVLTLAGFSAQSVTSITGGPKDFVSQDTRTSDSSALDLRGDVRVPAVVPEPVALVSGGIGAILLGMGWLSVRRWSSRHSNSDTNTR